MHQSLHVVNLTLHTTESTNIKIKYAHNISITCKQLCTL